MSNEQEGLEKGLPASWKTIESAGSSKDKQRFRAYWLLALFGFCLFPFGLTWWVLNYGVSTLQNLTEGREASICAERLMNLQKGLALYAESSDGRYPPAENWVDVSWRYMPPQKRDDPNSKPLDPSEESESVFRCPSISKRRTGEFGIALFRGIAGKSIAEIASPDTEPLLFDSDLMIRNSVSGLDSLPKPPRHKSSRFNNVVTVSGVHEQRAMGEAP